MMGRKFSFFIVTIVSFFLLPFPAFAHIIVKPSSVGIASVQTFDIQVPTEKDNATIGLRLLVPDGLSNVVPNVKPGWDINVVKNGDTVTEIDWTNGNIPSGQRDDFYFSAQVPELITTIPWKAYQTYADGSVVSWDQNPINTTDKTTPYSTTKIIHDVAITPAPSQSDEEHTSQKATLAFILAFIALAVASVALSIARRKKPLPLSLRRTSKNHTKSSRKRRK